MNSLRLAVILPAILALILLVIFGLFNAQLGSLASVTLLIAIACCISFTVFSTEFRLRRPLSKLLDGVPTNNPSAIVEVQRLALTLAALRQQASASDARVHQASQQAHELQAALQELAVRYKLMVERANDGVWEWDVQTGKIEFSPRWYGMLGFASVDGPTSIDQWKRLIHPDDNEAVLMRLQNHLENLTPHFNAEYRVGNRAGDYRWVHSRGSAIRHANGESYRMIVLDGDVHERKFSSANSPRL